MFAGQHDDELACSEKDRRQKMRVMADSDSVTLADDDLFIISAGAKHCCTGTNAQTPCIYCFLLFLSTDYKLLYKFSQDRPIERAPHQLSSSQT